jgi:ankyrin repeat protein
LLPILAATLIAADGNNPSEAFYAALRANDLPRLDAILKQGANVNIADNTGATPLMYAASVGSADAMKLLLDNGADVNLKSNADTTALMWSVTDIRKVRLLLEHRADVKTVSKRGRTALFLAALSDPSVDIVRLLMAAGADAKTVDAMKRTTLHAATVGNDTQTIRLLVEADADVNAADFAGFTPLINAATNGNVQAVRMLIARGADVNAVSGDGSFQKVKAGTIALGSWTPLLSAAACGPAELVKTLLDAGARANVQDVRGMTPLMLAVATDRQNPEVVATLIAKGADPNVKSLAGETALDWALKTAAKPAIEMIRRAGGVDTQVKAAAVPAFAPADLKPSVERSMRLLERTSVTAAANGGCASCHSHNIVDITAAVARRKGISIDAKVATDRQQLTKGPFFSPANLLERMDGPGTPDVPLYALVALASSAYAPDRITDATIANTIANQHGDGHWAIGTIARPPIEDGDIFRTALGIRALRVYGPPGRAAEIDERIARARAWLVGAKAITTEDRNMQLLGLHWAGVDRGLRRRLAKAVLAEQRTDGGWAQTVDLKSDAYATGQSLFALAEGAEVSPRDAAYRKGVAYLLSTQHGDGSWYVRSRAPKFQPFFESGFPYGHDQWISSMATGWATTALAYAIAP